MVKKGQSRLSGLDEKIVALYARGMSVRDIQGQLQEMYGVEVSPALISNVTDAQFIPTRKFINDVEELLEKILASGMKDIRWAAYIRADNLTPK